MARIVCTHSFRGGTGKSNLTANMAVILAAAGKRVGVIDTDVQSPGIHVLFGIDAAAPPRTLNDFLWRRAPIEAAVCDVGGVLAPEEATIYLVPASIKASEIARILREGYDTALLSEGYRALIETLRLDYLLIDTHPGLNEETLLSIAVSDLLIQVLRPDQQDFQGTAVALEVAHKLNVPEIVLAVNKVPSSLDPEELRDKVAATYDTEVAGVFPLAEEMVRLGSAGIFCLESPDHPWAREVGRLAERVG